MTEKEDEQLRNAKIPEFRKDFDDYMQKRQEAAQRETVGLNYKIRFERDEVTPLLEQKQNYDQRFDEDYPNARKGLNSQDLEERNEFNTWMKQERGHLRQLDDKDRFTQGGDYTDRPVSTSRTQSGFPHREVPRAVAAEQMRDEFDAFQDTLHLARHDALEANRVDNMRTLETEYQNAHRREAVHELKNVAPTHDPQMPLAAQVGSLDGDRDAHSPNQKTILPANQSPYKPWPGQKPEDYAREMRDLAQKRAQQPEPPLQPTKDIKR